MQGATSDAMTLRRPICADFRPNQTDYSGSAVPDFEKQRPEPSTNQPKFVV